MIWPVHFRLLAIVLWLVASVDSFAACQASVRNPQRIFIIGDSTAAEYGAEKKIAGWGQMMQARFGAGIRIRNMAVPGRSSRSFVSAGDWANVRSLLMPGDYVFIQFGHNDASGDPLRATRPFDDYAGYLQRYVAEAREQGAIPLLLTPVSKRLFDGGVFRQSHGAYPPAMLAVAGKTATPAIDLTSLSGILFSRLGESASFSLFMVSVDGSDNVHLTRVGANRIADLVADALRASGHPLAECLRDR